MCGIAGISKKGSSKQELGEIVVKMNKAQNRRGPDDSGVFIDEKSCIAFGHTRLSILDLTSAGHQPMLYPIPYTLYPNLVITFNGEIYNFLELKKELESIGYQFKTKTDTEVILAAYAEWGVESFSRLRGMFAFGLWDEAQKKIYLVKDRYGIKPLYYSSNNKKLVFASTVKALKASEMVSDKKNEKAVIGFLLFGSVPSPQTTIQDVYGIPAGHYLVRESSGENKLVKYYEPLEYFTHNQPPTTNNSVEDIANIRSNTRELLEESVRLHMISDAPLGVFLSGGIDSSVLAILAASNLGTSEVPRTSDVQNIGSKRLKTLSIVFNEQEYSEQKYQQIIAKQIKSDHQEYKITKSDFENSLADIWEAMDQPSIDGVNTYFVAQSAKKAGLKAVLSGLGGDEIFFGYPSFRMAKPIRQFQKYPRLALLPISILNKLGGKYSKLDYLKSNDILRFYLTFRGLFTVNEISKILNISIKEINNYIDELIVKNDLSSSKFNNLEPANTLSYLELKFYLQNQLLKDSDVMAMYHSIEIRVPFLDHRLVEYLSSLNASSKLAGIYPKQLLIDSILELPKNIYNRPKMGFTFPFEKWLKPYEDEKCKLKNAKLHWSRTWALNILERLK